MKIVIATPFDRPEKGILGKYTKGLAEAFSERGDTVEVVAMSSYGHLPVVVRHAWFFAQTLRASRAATCVLALDTWSVGMPAFFAAKLLGKRFAVRIGGDFLWEKYVQRTKGAITLSEFYAQKRDFVLLESCIFHVTRYMLHHTDAVIFTTKFQRDIWASVYAIVPERIRMVENYFPPKQEGEEPSKKVFVAAGRPIRLKNMDVLERAFARVQAKHPGIVLDRRSLPFSEHLARVRNCYAVIIPSYSEVCSNTAIEAVSYGKPFIMTEDTGTSERLAGTGLFIDTRSEDALVTAIETILSPEVYASLVTKARDFAHVHTWEEIAGEVTTAIR